MLMNMLLGRSLKMAREGSATRKRRKTPRIKSMISLIYLRNGHHLKLNSQIVYQRIRKE